MCEYELDNWKDQKILAQKERTFPFTQMHFDQLAQTLSLFGDI